VLTSAGLFLLFLFGRASKGSWRPDHLINDFQWILEYKIDLC
jgi:hypothetical protein